MRRPWGVGADCSLVMTAGTSWRQIPPEFGPWQTIYYRFQRWKCDGLGEQIRRILLS
ncbi:MAG: transposase [Ktedonobacterales bacterium]